MRKTIFDIKTAYPNYNYGKPTENSKLTARDFACMVDQEKQLAYETGMKACQDLNEIISRKVSGNEALSDGDKINIAACIKTYGCAMKVMEVHAEKTKKISELLTEFGRVTHLVLAAPKEFLFSMSAVDLFAFVNNVFVLGNTNKYALDKVSGMVAALGKQLDQKNISSKIYEEIKFHSKRLRAVREDVFYMKLAIDFEIQTYVVDVYRQHPGGTAPDEISSRMRAYGDLIPGSLTKPENITSEIYEKRINNIIIPSPLEEHELQAYFEKNKKDMNGQIVIWAHALSYRLNKGDSAVEIARDLKAVLEIIVKYCDYYFEETHWFQKEEILLNKANKSYLMRLKDFMEQNISIMFDVGNGVIKNNVDSNFEIDKDSFRSIFNGKIHKDAAVAWDGYLSSQGEVLVKENDSSESVNDGVERKIFQKNINFVNIDLISTRNIYSLEVAISRLTDKLLEQIASDDLNNDTPLNEEAISTYEVISQNTETIQEESKSMSEGVGHAVISAASLEKNAYNHKIVVSVPSIIDSIPPKNGADTFKIENLTGAKNTIKLKDARQMMHPDVYEGDLKKMPYPGGEVYLKKKRVFIGHIWQAEDRRKPTVSYANSNQPEVYTLFPQKVLEDLSRGLSSVEYADFMEHVQAKTFLKSKYKEQGIIKIAEENTYEMRLFGGARPYRVLFDLNPIKNNKNLFLSKTDVHVVKEVFFHNGKTNKTLAKLEAVEIKEIASILSLRDIYIKPSLNLHN